MATRIYLPSSGAAAVTPTNWLHPYTCANNYTYAGVTTKINSAFANREGPSGGNANYIRGMVRYVIGPLTANEISGNVAALIRAIEGNVKANCTISLGIHIIQANGANRSTLLAAVGSDSAAAPYEIATSIQSRYAYSAAEAQPGGLRDLMGRSAAVALAAAVGSRIGRPRQPANLGRNRWRDRV